MLRSLLFAFLFYHATIADFSSRISLIPNNNASMPDLEISLTNSLNTGVYILIWNTPWDTFNPLSSLSVSRNGKIVPYEGPVVKHGDPQKNHYLLVPGRTSITKKIQLEGFFDVSLPGQYSFQLNLFLGDHIVDGTKVPRTKDHFQGVAIPSSNRLQFTVAAGFQQQSKQIPQLNASYTGCSAAQIKVIQTAANSALTYSKVTNEVLSGGGGPTYPTWFGTGSKETVKKIYSLTEGMFANSKLNYKCNDPNCDSGTYAFVYPSDPNFVVYLCGAFWISKDCGQYDSKCGTLVHETTHFNAVGSTNDWAYGTTAAKNLAKSNPSRAINNADNYEYFFESQI